MNRHEFLKLLLAVLLSPIVPPAPPVPADYVAAMRDAFRGNEGTIMVWWRIDNIKHWKARMGRPSRIIIGGRPK